MKLEERKYIYNYNALKNMQLWLNKMINEKKKNKLKNGNFLNSVFPNNNLVYNI